MLPQIDGVQRGMETCQLCVVTGAFVLEI